eukprot:gb/GECH01010933.1/.p1 GENE.gb/GECH01010933.1/~~gb/GECH01010933.1/.p1  ORF type:complete len:893 (+),score=166.53 gb/GECH01010933.1/:1-2679(+)
MNTALERFFQHTTTNSNENNNNNHFYQIIQDVVSLWIKFGKKMEESMFQKIDNHLFYYFAHNEKQLKEIQHHTLQALYKGSMPIHFDSNNSIDHPIMTFLFQVIFNAPNTAQELIRCHLSCFPPTIAFWEQVSQRYIRQGCAGYYSHSHEEVIIGNTLLEFIKFYSRKAKDYICTTFVYSDCKLEEQKVRDKTCDTVRFSFPHVTDGTSFTVFHASEKKKLRFIVDRNENSSLEFCHGIVHWLRDTYSIQRILQVWNKSWNDIPGGVLFGNNSSLGGNTSIYAMIPNGEKIEFLQAISSIMKFLNESSITQCLLGVPIPESSNDYNRWEFLDLICGLFMLSYDALVNNSIVLDVYIPIHNNQELLQQFEQYFSKLSYVSLDSSKTNYMPAPLSLGLNSLIHRQWFWTDSTTLQPYLPEENLLIDLMYQAKHDLYVRGRTASSMPQNLTSCASYNIIFHRMVQVRCSTGTERVLQFIVLSEKESNLLYCNDSKMYYNFLDDSICISDLPPIDEQKQETAHLVKFVSNSTVFAFDNGLVLTKSITNDKTTLSRFYPTMKTFHLNTTHSIPRFVPACIFSLSEDITPICQSLSHLTNFQSKTLCLPFQNLFYQKIDEHIKAERTRNKKEKSLTIEINNESETVTVYGTNETVKPVITNLIKALWFKTNDEGIYVFPQTWSQPTDKLQTIGLNTESSEYRFVANLFNETLPRFVVSIERIQNPVLFQEYAANRRWMAHNNIIQHGFEDSQHFSALKEDANQNGNAAHIFEIEKFLWHGTSQISPDKIYATREGFDMRLARDGLLGRGTYFAEKALYSDTYAYKQQQHPSTKSMILARVLTGRSYSSSKTTRYTAPPYLDHDNTTRYDSVNVNTTKSRIYAIYQNKLSYPEYIVTYR